MSSVGNHFFCGATLFVKGDQMVRGSYDLEVPCQFFSKGDRGDSVDTDEQPDSWEAWTTVKGLQSRRGGSARPGGGEA